ncbi:MAG: hypothetical protein B6244_04775 [Candidatus Cloacimonetes bacterium 4572_55]|nr:MAG: hypothetical protein B6244_04775 [Candidatus Cloacimonetes bacterium 4572_55]
MRALIIEDHPITQKLLSKIISDYGYEATVCNFGKEGLACYKQNFFPLIIMDIGLSDMSCLNICRGIRSCPDGEYTIILIITGDATKPDEVHEILDSGANDYIERSANPELFGIRLKILSRHVQIRLERQKDAAKQERDRSALQESELRFRAIFEGSGVGICLGKDDEPMLEVNSAFINMLGYGKEELRCMEFLDFTHPDDAELEMAHFQKLFNGETDHYQIEKRYIHKNGNVVWGQLIYTMAPIQGTDSRFRIVMVTDITRRKKAEASLLRLEMAVEQSVDGVAVADMMNRLQVSNSAWARMHGFYADELIGKHLETFHTPKQAREQLAPFLERVKDAGSWQEEIDHIHRDGRTFTTWMTASLLWNARGEQIGIVSTVRDITEKKKVEEALRGSEARYRGLIESFPEAIFVKQEGGIVYVNPAGLRLLGYESLDQIQGFTLTDLFEKEDERSLEGFIPLGDNLPFPMVEGRFVRRDKTPIDVEITFINTTYQKSPAILVVTRDVTEINALQKKSQQIDHLAELGQLSATIAHEIRNPLGSVSLNFDYLSHKLKIEELEEDTYIDIKQGIQRIQDIIKDILDYARPTPPNLCAENIHLVLDQSIRSMETRLAKSNIQIVKEYGEISFEVLIDTNQIIQVFVNLISNACQVTPDGGTLTIRTQMENDLIAVQIIDTGEGIPEENLKKIFSPFYTTRTKGMGLGLAVVWRIVEAHNATISVVSEVDVGTTFTVKILR